MINMEQQNYSAKNILQYSQFTLHAVYVDIFVCVCVCVSGVAFSYILMDGFGDDDKLTEPVILYDDRFHELSESEEKSINMRQCLEK